MMDQEHVFCDEGHADHKRPRRQTLLGAFRDCVSHLTPERRCPMPRQYQGKTMPKLLVSFALRVRTDRREQWLGI